MVAVVAAMVVVCSFSPVGATALDSIAGSVLDGTLLVAHRDGATGAMVMQTALRSRRATCPSRCRHRSTRDGCACRPPVQVRGSRDAASFAATSISPAASGAATAHATIMPTRSMRVAVVLMRLPGSSAQPVTKASLQASVFGPTNSVANWYSQMSGGQVTVTGTVYGYYGGVRSCDLSTELAAAAAAATAGGYVAANFDDLVVYTPDQGCDFSGMGWIGTGGVFLNGDASRGVFEHELGHNLGLRHAGAYACGDAVSSGCLVEYGDPTDVMGDPTLGHGYSAEHKYMLGWIPAAEVRTVTTGAQTIALTASEDPLVPGSTELIHVRAADGTLFAVDRRASVGYDAGIAGVWVRKVASVGTDDTELVRDHALAAGQTFSDPARKVSITTVSDSGRTASIRVCVGSSATDSTQYVAAEAAAITARNIATAAKTSTANRAITLTVVAGHGVAAGHTVIVSTYASRVGGSVMCSDSRGDVYGVNINSLGAQRLIVCSAHAAVGLRPGATITVRYPAFNGSTLSSANDVSGIRSVARADRARARGANSSTPDSGTTMRTRHRAELVFGVVVHRGVSGLTPVSGFRRIGAVTAGSGDARITINPAFKVVSATGVFKVAGTLAPTRQWRAAVVTFIAA